MEKKIVVTKRFGNNTFQVYQYLLQNFSSNVAFLFLDKIEERIDFDFKTSNYWTACSQKAAYQKHYPHAKQHAILSNSEK